MSGQQDIPLQGIHTVLLKNKTETLQVKFQKPMCLQRPEISVAVVYHGGYFLLSLPGGKVYSVPKDTHEA